MQCSPWSSKLAVMIFGLIALVFFGELFLWIFTMAPIAGLESSGSMLWYLFSFLSGVGAMGLPFALPFLFLIVPLVKRNGLALSGSVLFSLSAGLCLILTLYGVATAALGATVMEQFTVKGTHLKDWINIFSGIFIYVLALGELGLVRFRLSSYGGTAPRFIQKRNIIGTAFFLGIFLGNIGIASAYPAIPLLLIESTSSGSMIFGGILLAVHALGRIAFLVVAMLFAVYGMNSVGWVTRHSERLTRLNGWAMIAVASLIMTLGVFSHEWWGATRLHTALVTGSIGESVLPISGAPATIGVFGLPPSFAGWMLFLLLTTPLWWYFRREYVRIYGTPAMELKRLEHTIGKLEETRRHLEVIAHIPQGEHGAHVLHIEHELDLLETKRRLFENAVRYGAQGGLRSASDEKYEEEGLRLRKNLYGAVTLLALLTVMTFF